MSLEPPPFQESSRCDVCKCSFNTFRRRHHCRCCGRTLCAEHSSDQMAYQVSRNYPPMLLKDSDFEKWTVDFIEFISRRENGDLLIKSFTEGPLVLYKDKEEFTTEEINQKRADKDAKSYLMLAIPKLPYHISSRLNAYINPMFMWKELTKIMHGSIIDFRVNIKKNSGEEKEEKKDDDKMSDENKEREQNEEKKDDDEDSEIVIELNRRLKEVKDLLTLERHDHKKEKESLLQRITDLEKDLKIKSKEVEDKKGLELTCQRLSKQNSDFQKVLFLEKEKVEKERVEFETKRKQLEVKNEKLSEKISALQLEMDRDCAELEKMKKADFQAKSVKDDFSVERKIFQQEIHKLTKNLAGLSTDIMREKRTNCDIRKKLDLMTKERNAFSDKVRSFNKSGSYSDYLMHPSNIFYDHSVDNSSKSYVDLPLYKRVNMQWKEKGKFPEKDVPKSSFPNKSTKPNVKYFTKPDSVHSSYDLIRLAQKNICCSYCGTNDFVKNANVQFWYGTYHVSSYRTPLNVSGPKTCWVPKST